MQRMSLVPLDLTLISRGQYEQTQMKLPQDDTAGIQCYWQLQCGQCTKRLTVWVQEQHRIAAWGEESLRINELIKLSVDRHVWLYSQCHPDKRP